MSTRSAVALRAPVVPSRCRVGRCAGSVAARVASASARVAASACRTASSATPPSVVASVAARVLGGGGERGAGVGRGPWRRGPRRRRRPAPGVRRRRAPAPREPRPRVPASRPARRRRDPRAPSTPTLHPHRRPRGRRRRQRRCCARVGGWAFSSACDGSDPPARVTGTPLGPPSAATPRPDAPTAIRWNRVSACAQGNPAAGRSAHMTDLRPTLSVPASGAHATPPGVRPLTADELGHLDRARAYLRASGADLTDLDAVGALLHATRTRWAAEPDAPVPQAMVMALGVGVGDLVVARVPGCPVGAAHRRRRTHPRGRVALRRGCRAAAGRRRDALADRVHPDVGRRVRRRSRRPPDVAGRPRRADPASSDAHRARRSRGRADTAARPVDVRRPADPRTGAGLRGCRARTDAVPIGRRHGTGGVRRHRAAPSDRARRRPGAWPPELGSGPAGPHVARVRVLQEPGRRCTPAAAGPGTGSRGVPRPGRPPPPAVAGRAGHRPRRARAGPRDRARAGELARPVRGGGRQPPRRASSPAASRATPPGRCRRPARGCAARERHVRRSSGSGSSPPRTVTRCSSRRRTRAPRASSSRTCYRTVTYAEGRTRPARPVGEPARPGPGRAPALTPWERGADPDHRPERAPWASPSPSSTRSCPPSPAPPSAAATAFDPTADVRAELDRQITAYVELGRRDAAR